MRPKPIDSIYSPNWVFAMLVNAFQIHSICNHLGPMICVVDSGIKKTFVSNRFWVGRSTCAARGTECCALLFIVDIDTFNKIRQVMQKMCTALAPAKNTLWHVHTAHTTFSAQVIYQSKRNASCDELIHQALERGRREWKCAQVS